MPTYVFVDKNPTSPPGARERIVVIHPGDFHAVVKWAKSIGLGGAHQAFTVCTPEDLLAQMGGQPSIVAIQISQGQVPVTVQQPQLSGQHVQGGQPTGHPHAQPGANHTGGDIDPRSKFQPLPDDAIGVGSDPMYGEMNDGTVTDLVNTPMGLGEYKRPKQ